MMNKSLLPSTIQLPFLGHVVCLSQALRYNIGLILFCKILNFMKVQCSTKDETLFRLQGGHGLLSKTTGTFGRNSSVQAAG